MDRQEFSQFLTDVYRSGALMSAIAIGHDLGLFEVLCDTDKPLSLHEIADKKKFKERYTREWLSSMVAARIIHQDRQTNLYTVPEDHKEILKLRTSFAPVVTVLVNKTEHLKNCFSIDGPSGYGLEENPAWFRWFNNYRATMADHTLETTLLPNFKDQGVTPKLEAGINVLDLGCGVGSFIIGLASRFPKSTFTGLEYSETVLDMARENHKKTKLENISFVHGDAQNLPDSWLGVFDLVFVYDVLHDLPSPNKALEEIHMVLKDDGGFSLIEIGCHSNPVDNVGDMTAAMYYSLSMFVCLPSSMSDCTSEGYGACWGREETEKALLRSKFKIQGKSFIKDKVFFYCTK